MGIFLTAGKNKRVTVSRIILAEWFTVSSLFTPIDFCREIVCNRGEIIVPGCLISKISRGETAIKTIAADIVKWILAGTIRNEIRLTMVKRPIIIMAGSPCSAEAVMAIR
ncbi:MAG: hypothetical protein UV05_C0060G0003 [candidate division CPR1 bacterium GW2011_GWA2_42_17]|uniref:Uncharacterized protein n=1 Tax=candidate division CPR1 bacterium GW2011_GWA2_42_17 TaxID=1618341 RepID=A0A0G0YX31_9BACT|nr:MAG: hypothetical protein UV05_C0060G0003 [candidate division CPR1 bacterium GW2011_GWA2_42_17]